MFIDQQPVWNTGDLCEAFDTIMFDMRGWSKTRLPVIQARRKAMKSYAAAVRRFGSIVNLRRSAFPIPSHMHRSEQ